MSRPGIRTRSAIGLHTRLARAQLLQPKPKEKRDWLDRVLRRWARSILFGRV